MNQYTTNGLRGKDIMRPTQGHGEIGGGRPAAAARPRRGRGKAAVGRERSRSRNLGKALLTNDNVRSSKPH